MTGGGVVRARVALGATLLSLAMLIGVIVTWQPVAANAASTTQYSFEDCDEGWTVEENFTGPTTTTTWARSEPGAPADPQTLAFRSFPYPPGAGAPEDVYEASVTSPPHPHTGGSVVVSYYIQHDLEDGVDFLYFEWSRDGKAWTQVEEFTGLSAGFPEFSLIESTFIAPAGPVLARFRLVADQLITGATGEGQVAFDEVVVPFDRPPGSACGAAPSASASSSPTASASPSPSRPPGPARCTISGTRRSDTLRGTPRSDVICGKGGGDQISGSGGRDTLRGDRGPDRLNGGPGRDDCSGGPGRDRFKGCEQAEH